MPAADKTPERPVHGGTCVGCGHYHGSLNKRLDCLERALKEARQDIEDLKVLVANAR
jgi:hypothetical protein